MAYGANEISMKGDPSMTTFNRPGQSLPIVPVTSTLDRLRGGPLALPAHGTLRPNLMERVTASRSERVLMRQRDAAAATVESVQIQAAVEVAVALTEDAKALRLRACRVCTDSGFPCLQVCDCLIPPDAGGWEWSKHILLRSAVGSLLLSKRAIAIVRLRVTSGFRLAL
jgi:hypothetical protein